MTRTWNPTHRVYPPNDEPYDVQLEEGAGYTRKEWRDVVNSDLEYHADGTWTFQGQPFAGRVVRLHSDANLTFTAACRRARDEIVMSPQGTGYVVSEYDEARSAVVVSGELTFFGARERVATARAERAAQLFTGADGEAVQRAASRVYPEGRFEDRARKIIEQLTGSQRAWR